MAVKNSVVADSEVMKAWNSIIFDPAFENSAMGARKNVFVNNVVVEVLFASSSFSKDVEVRIDQDQRFYKSTLIKHEPEIHHQYLDYLLKKKLNPSLSNIFPVVMKCIVLRDTLCHGTGPKCCQTKTSSYPLCYLVQKQKQELNSSVSQISIVDSIFNGCLDLSQSLSANPERLHDLLTGYKLFLVNSCSSQVEIVQILNSLRAPTITRLQKEFDSLGPVNLLSVLMGSFKGDLDCDESFRDSYGSWETALLRIGIPDLNALAYIHLFQSRKSEIVRIKYLEKFEEMLSSTGKDLAQEAFQNSVGILAGQIQSKLLHDYTPEILLSAYFDILNLADSNLRNLFKVNVRLLFMLQQPANEDEELEEGEELGMGLDGPDDVTAAALLFRPRLKQIGAFDHTIEVYESSPNILIFPEILQARPDDPFESKRLLRLMVDYWTFASIEIPANVFNQSLEQVILHYFGSIANQMLDHVFVKFMFTHYWTIEVILPPLLAMVGNVKELLSDTVSPISALYDHFSLLSVASNPSAEERRFLEVLVLEITKLIPSPDPAGAKNQVKHAKKKTKPLEPKFAGKFPRNQVKFLAGLIAVMPKNMIELTALRIIEPLRSSGSRILQKFLVSLWSELKQEPSDLILEVLFPPLPDNVETLKSWSIQDWDIIANYLQSRLNSATPGPVCKRVLVSYLSSTLHEPYTNFVRETVR